MLYHCPGFWLLCARIVTIRAPLHTDDMHHASQKFLQPSSPPGHTVMASTISEDKTSTVCGLGDSVTWTARFTDDLVKSSTQRTFGPCTTPNLLLSGQWFGTESADNGPTSQPLSTSSIVFCHTAPSVEGFADDDTLSKVADLSRSLISRSSDSVIKAGANLLGHRPHCSTSPTSDVPFTNSFTTPMSGYLASIRIFSHNFTFLLAKMALMSLCMDSFNTFSSPASSLAHDNHCLILWVLCLARSVTVKWEFLFTAIDKICGRHCCIPWGCPASTAFATNSSGEWYMPHVSQVTFAPSIETSLSTGARLSHPLFIRASSMGLDVRRFAFGIGSGQAVVLTWRVTTLINSGTNGGSFAIFGWSPDCALTACRTCSDWDCISLKVDGGAIMPTSRNAWTNAAAISRANAKG